MTQRRHSWVPASSDAALVIRAAFGCTATFGYSIANRTHRTQSGRRYYVHVTDELRPKAMVYFSDSDLQALERRYGRRRDAVIAERIISQYETGIRAEPSGVFHSEWMTP